MPAPLPFETEIHALEEILTRLEQGGSGADVIEETKRTRRELNVRVMSRLLTLRFTV